MEDRVNTDEPVRPSEECVDLLRRASESDDEDVYGPLIDQSLAECGTVDRWTAAVREHPGALAVSEPELVDPSVDLAAVCLPRVADAPVCAEAIETGLIPEPAE